MAQWGVLETMHCFPLETPVIFSAYFSFPHILKSVDFKIGSHHHLPCFQILTLHVALY